MWAGSKDLLEGNPHLNSIYHKNLIKKSALGVMQDLWPLRKNRYDISFNTHPQSRIAYRVVARFINAQTRISHEYDNVSPMDALLVNKTLRQDYQRHSVENNLALLELVGKKATQAAHSYDIFLSAEERAWAEEYIRANSLGGHTLLGIHVGSGGTKNLALRRWPLASYAALVKRLTSRNANVRILLFGGPEEEKDHAWLMTETQDPAVLFPKTASLRHAAALIQKCDAFLSVDTVLMHVAAAVKVGRQVVIETPTWNKPIEPFGQSFTLVPNPAVAGRNLQFYRYDGEGIKGTEEEIVRCMRSVTVEAVEAELEKALP
jgi:heptosyltransferase-2